MKIIVRPNNSGKTRDLIEYALETNTPIFAITDSKAKSLREKSLAYFEKPVQIVTLIDIIENTYNGDVLIDDIEKCFKILLDALVDGESAITIAGFSASED